LGGARAGTNLKSGSNLLRNLLDRPCGCQAKSSLKSNAIALGPWWDQWKTWRIVTDRESERMFTISVPSAAFGACVLRCP